MKLTKYATIALVAATSFVVTKPAIAQEMTQEQQLKQECEVQCEVGAYGQNTSCVNKCYQEGTQKQTITLGNGTIIKTHQPVNTGLDMNTAAVAVSLVMTGVGATLTRRKFLLK